MRTEAEVTCRIEDVERGWKLLQEGVGEIANKCFKSTNMPKKDYISDETWKLIKYRQMLAYANAKRTLLKVKTMTTRCR